MELVSAGWRVASRTTASAALRLLWAHLLALAAVRVQAVHVKRTQLIRSTPLRAKPRSKGNRAEREIIDILKAHGWTGARRNFQSGGQGGGDITGGPAGCNVEVKHQERCTIWEWIAQSENDARPTDIPLVVFRRNRSSWYACLPLEELLALLALRERG